MGYVPGDECHTGHVHKTLFAFYEGQKVDVLVNLEIVQFA
jgi:hypothetical protein